MARYFYVYFFSFLNGRFGNIVSAKAIFDKTTKKCKGKEKLLYYDIN